MYIGDIRHVQHHLVHAHLAHDGSVLTIDYHIALVGQTAADAIRIANGHSSNNTCSCGCKGTTVADGFASRQRLYKGNLSFYRHHRLKILVAIYHMSWMQSIQGNALTHHIQLIFLQLRQRGAVGDVPYRNMHSLGFNKLKGLLKACKLISSIVLIIRIRRGEMREHTLDVDAGQGCC